METQGAQTHHFRNSTESENNYSNNNHHNNVNYNRNLMVKTELCRRFRRGVCGHGSKCDFAHSVAELRRQPKLCRLFLQNKHCPYGRTCRYLHSATPTPPPLPPQPSTFQIPNLKSQSGFLLLILSSHNVDRSIHCLSRVAIPWRRLRFHH